MALILEHLESVPYSRYGSQLGMEERGGSAHAAFIEVVRQRPADTALDIGT